MNVGDKVTWGGVEGVIDQVYRDMPDQFLVVFPMVGGRKLFSVPGSELVLVNR